MFAETIDCPPDEDAEVKESCGADQTESCFMLLSLIPKKLLAPPVTDRKREIVRYREKNIARVRTQREEH